MAKDISQIIEEHSKNLEVDIILIGHSMGGALAVHTALEGFYFILEAKKWIFQIFCFKDKSTIWWV